MIDPKFNQLPPEGATTNTQAGAGSNLETERPATAREGLSINDTIAGDTLLSSGARGVDTSGVRSGAGVGAGSSNVTPGSSVSPAPSLVSGARGTGMTPAGSTSSGQSPVGRADTGVPGTGTAASEESGQLEAGADTYEPTTDEISSHAFRCWHERGCPEGSPEVDWERARNELRSRRKSLTASA